MINNNGYSIERIIHGPKAEYNDIQPWRHTELLSAFGADPDRVRTYQARTHDEMERLFTNDEFNKAGRLQVRSILGDF